MTTWVLESNRFSEKCFDRMIAHFERKNINYYVISIIPFSHELVGNTPKIHGNVVTYGSIGMQDVTKKEGWLPGVWTGIGLDESTVMGYLGEHYMNSDGKIKKFGNLDLPEIFFVKPEKDTKIFAGEVITRTEYLEWCDRVVVANINDVKNSMVVVSSPKHIFKEWRAVIVDGKVSSMSLYRLDGRQYVLESNDLAVQIFCDSMIKIYNPYPVYVMDIGLTSDGLKVIEYNTFNHSGLYDCDVTIIIDNINSMLFRERGAGK